METAKVAPPKALSFVYDLLFVVVLLLKPMRAIVSNVPSQVKKNSREEEAQIVVLFH